MRPVERWSLVRAIGRQFHLVEDQAGESVSWTYAPAGERPTRYQFDGIKAPDDWKSDRMNALVLLWSAKDWLRRSLPAGVTTDVEQYVNANRILCICADLANLWKHGVLTTSRSGEWPAVGKVAFTAPKTSIAQIAVLESEVLTVFQNPDGVEFSLSVLNRNGLQIAEAGAVARGSWEAWRAFMARNGIPAE